MGSPSVPRRRSPPHPRGVCVTSRGWKDALASGKVFNAMDGCKEAGIDADALRKAWAVAKKGGKLVKPGGGF